METPRVSVIIPVYNAEKYLRGCMGSVLGQTLRELEVICVDDGSTDGSAAILAEYAENDSRVRVLRQENKGAGAARNLGIDAAKGEYVAFCSSDNLITLAHPMDGAVKKSYKISEYSTVRPILIS